MNPNDPHLSRRAFLRRGCCAAVGATGVLSTLAQLRAMGAVAQAGPSGLAPRTALPGNYKALVCVFLQGGNDAMNVIIPSDSASYAAYATTRADIAVGQSSLLPLASKTYNDGRTWGMNPAMPELQGLFTQGKLAVLANVGTLVEPTTLKSYISGASVPPQLFSHADQILQWQSSVPDQPFKTGWGGRLADLINAFNTNPKVSMSISVNGTNSFEQGNTLSQLVCSPFGVTQMNVPFFQASNAQTIAAAENILGAANPNPNLLAAAFGGLTLRGMQDGTLLAGLLSSAPALSTKFPGTQSGAELATVAALISIAPSLGLTRQIFFVGLGGWDTHNFQINTQTELLSEVSAALNAFYNATVELGIANQVTTFTASDFGRAYVPNAGGTDHGWGNHQFILGGAVNGGDIYGTMPSLAVGGSDDTGQGRWIPSTSVDEYSATLATWFGVSNADLSTVLPNVGRFAHPNLGFMG